MNSTLSGYKKKDFSNSNYTKKKFKLYQTKRKQISSRCPTYITSSHNLKLKQRNFMKYLELNEVSLESKAYTTNNNISDREEHN